MAGAMRSSKGELYEMPAASWDHAVTIMNLILLLAPVAQALGGRVLTAPLDVFFEGADGGHLCWSR